MNSESSSRRIFNITVTEILFVLIFAVTAAVVVSQVELDSSVKEIHVLQTEFNELENEFNILNRKFLELEIENKKLREQVEILNRVIDELTVGDGKGIDIGAAGLRKYIAELERKVKKLEEIIRLRNKTILEFKDKGTGKAKCTYGDIPIKQLFSVYIYDDYFELTPLWNLFDEKIFVEIDWIREMKEKGRLSTKEFNILGNKHIEWANAQIPRCRYQVRAYKRTENDKLFMEQRDEVDNKFIACHVLPESENPGDRSKEKCRGSK